MKAWLVKVFRNRAFYARIRRFFDDHPRLQPLIRGINQATLKVQGPRPITFSGWGMTSEHALPWDDPGWSAFEETADLVKRFEFAPEAFTTDEEVDALRWRHWIVSFAVSYAFGFADAARNLEMAECGVAEGVSSFFALRQAQREIPESKSFRMHLYDAWAPMQAADLTESEWWRAGTYDWLSVERTKRNLAAFEANMEFHVGHLPEALDPAHYSPEASLVYVSIDLNSAVVTKAACEFFLPRLARNGVMLFDDYAHLAYTDTRLVVDEFFADQAGRLMKVPTGQAIWFQA